MLKATFARRFDELTQKFSALPVHANYTGTGKHYKQADWKQWGTSAQSLLRAVCGPESDHFKNFARIFDACHDDDYQVHAMHGVFAAAKEDFQGGYLFNVELLVSGEVFGDFVVLAKEAMAKGHKDVAAVLACAALEDALKRYAMANSLDTDDKDMSNIINALKAAGLVSGPQKSLLDAMPKVRNAALHAQWDKLTEPEVSSVIGFVEQFLLTKFGETV